MRPLLLPVYLVMAHIVNTEEVGTEFQDSFAVVPPPIQLTFAVAPAPLLDPLPIVPKDVTSLPTVPRASGNIPVPGLKSCARHMPQGPVPVTPALK